jgi:uncharacterized protein YdhG (YjbR/CyaY superfamily)
MTKLKPPTNNTEAVNEFMVNLEHPFKTEVQAVRDIIKGVNEDITEQIKWNAPSFSYKGNYLVTFNLHARKNVHLVFHNPEISKVKSEILEGDYPDRRMVYFTDMEDIRAKKAALEKAVDELVKLQTHKDLSI